MVQIPNPTNWALVETTLYDWFSEQVDPLPVIWGNQDAPQPNYPFATITIIAGPTPVYEFDELRASEALVPEDVKLTATGQRKITVSLSIFVAPLGSLDPAVHARMIAQRVITSLAFYSIREVFRAANMSCIRQLGGLVTDSFIADTWIARAVVDLQFVIASESAETVGSIKTVRLEGVPPELADLYGDP
jgi:hypothetical protein